MITITSKVTVRPELQKQALAYSLGHCKRSREEEGCLSHNVFLHPEDPNCFFFYELWKDQPAIDLHFAKPYSQELAMNFKQWANEPLTLIFSEIAGQREHTVCLACSWQPFNTWP